MICWLCNDKGNDEISSDSFLSKLGLHDIDVVVYSSRIWYRHVESSKGWIAKVCKLDVVAQHEVLLDDMTERSLEWIMLILRIAQSGEVV